MAALGDVCVNDAFGSARRAQASTEGVAHFLPAVARFLMDHRLEWSHGSGVTGNAVATTREG